MHKVHAGTPLFCVYLIFGSNADTACRHTIQKYVCPRCQRTYTSLDVASFPMQNWEFLCERCNDDGVACPMQVSYQGHDGTLLDAKERDQRVAKAKLMQVQASVVLTTVSQMISS